MAVTITGSSCGMAETIEKVKEQMRPLDFYGSRQYQDSVVEYFRYYGLDFTGERVRHIFGTFESNGLTLAAHIFEPGKYTATVFVLHGYFDHCGQLRHLIKYLIEQGYAVAVFDLPGHGLSGGKRGYIEDFSQYSDALYDFVKVVKPQLKGPYHFVGHSTGGAAVLDYLFADRDDISGKVILAAPLVRWVAWEQSKIVYRLHKLSGKNIPRVFRKNSSDKEFLKFIKRRDPLQARTMPLEWVEALYKWNDRIADLPVCRAKVKVIQPTSDATVDWQFNIDFIKDKFSDVEVSLIENCRHELFNESAEIRAEVFSQINNYLEKK